MPPARSLFASASIPRHLARGASALLVLATIPPLLQTGGVLGNAGVIVAALSAVVLLRGCPMCWMVGLLETLTLRASRGPEHVDHIQGDSL